MVTRATGAVFKGLAAAAVLVAGAGGFAPSRAKQQPPTADPVPDHVCAVDLRVAGQMKDIVSNALGRGFDRPGASVAAFMDGAETRYASGPELLRAAAARFGLTEAELLAEVERHKHVNCGVRPTSDEDRGRHDGVEASEEAWAFARHVTLHVVLHEIGHGLVREFDLPVLGNEETAADAFATHYLVMHMPERAVDVLKARVTSLMIEAGEGPAEGWSGEHDHDGRRAYQIAALAVAADAEKYAPVAAVVGMSKDDIDDAADYGAEIHRSWRRVLTPLWMPAGAASGEARVSYDARSVFVRRVCEGGLAEDIERALRRFDWHSMVKVDFVDGEGGAGWNRSRRTVTVNSEYVARFVAQAERD